jgi:hypothetical protein
MNKVVTPHTIGLAPAAASRRDGLALGPLLVRGPAWAPPLPAAPPATPGRKRIWELSHTLHCSIVGTCLSTADLRQLLGKFDVGNGPALSDHDLHKYGVSIAGQRDKGGKLLHKLLDKRHAAAIAQLGKARSEAELARLWGEAVGRGEIPGAYWAVLTHPACGDALLRRAFGEVHMLSHLVGAANRADIRRLREIEAENAELRQKVERQQAQLRDAIVARDDRIRDLSALLANAVARDASPDALEAPAGRETLAALVAHLERRLEAATAHGQRQAERLRAAEARAAEAEAARLAAERREQALRAELEAAEAALAPAEDGTAAAEPGALSGRTLLYVGGQAGQVPGLRQVAARFAAELLHHDGGIEDRNPQLAGLVSRASLVFFPVDCVSHDAMQVVKRLSRQAAKPYVPLRSAGLTSFLAALRTACAALPAESAPA